MGSTQNGAGTSMRGCCCLYRCIFCVSDATNTSNDRCCIKDALDLLTCKRWFPCVCSAVGRNSGSTGELPVQTAMGTPCCRGGSGRSAAPGVS